LNETPFLPVLLELLRRREAGEANCAVAVVNPRGAVAGWTSLMPDPMWPDRGVLDVYCSPAGWTAAVEMIRDVLRARAGRVIAYSDTESVEKDRALRATGFRPVATLPGWLDATAVGPSRGLVSVWEHFA
jgi:hypothetical protein